MKPFLVPLLLIATILLALELFNYQTPTAAVDAMHLPFGISLFGRSSIVEVESETGNGSTAGENNEKSLLQRIRDRIPIFG